MKTLFSDLINQYKPISSFQLETLNLILATLTNSIQRDNYI